MIIIDIFLGIGYNGAVIVMKQERMTWIKPCIKF